MIYGYARVSKESQDPDPQVEQLTREGVQIVRVEVASAGAQRPILDALIAELCPGDSLYVTRLDRLGRSLYHLCAIAGRLAEQGVRLRALREGWDYATAAGRIQFAVLAALAEIERDLIRERSREWAEDCRRRGGRNGRPPAITRQQAELARELIDGGKTVAEVSRLLGVHRNTILRALARESWLHDDRQLEILPAKRRARGGE